MHKKQLIIYSEGGATVRFPPTDTNIDKAGPGKWEESMHHMAGGPTFDTPCWESQSPDSMGAWRWACGPQKNIRLD